MPQSTASSDGIFVQTGTVTIANSIVQTSLVGTGIGNLTLPSNYLYAGKYMKGDMSGTIATTANPTARIVLKIGSTTLVDSESYRSRFSYRDTGLLLRVPPDLQDCWSFRFYQGACLFPV